MHNLNLKRGQSQSAPGGGGDGDLDAAAGLLVLTGGGGGGPGGGGGGLDVLLTPVCMSKSVHTCWRLPQTRKRGKSGQCNLLALMGEGGGGP